MGGRAKRMAVSCAAMALVIVGSVATRPEMPTEWDWRSPCESEVAWAPNAPLYVHWAKEDRVWREGEAFASSIWLQDEHGAEIELLWSTREDGLVVLCPRGGLQPDSRYRWNVEALARSGNHTRIPTHDDGGTWEFETGPADKLPRIETTSACHAHTLPPEVLVAQEHECNPCSPEDTGWSSGWNDGCPSPRDTSEPDDTGDSGDTGTSSDSGDTGDDDPADNGDSATPWDTGASAEGSDTGVDDTADGGLE